MPSPRIPEDDLTPVDRLPKLLEGAMTPLSEGVSYYIQPPSVDDDMKEFLHEPAGAVPPSVWARIAPVRLVLVPYLARNGAGAAVSFREPVLQNRLRSAYLTDGATLICLGVKGEDPSEYHQVFFSTIAHLLSRKLEIATIDKYAALLAAESKEHVHGEVNEESWQLKQGLPSTKGNGSGPNVKSKLFREYATQSFADTMTLYMHGICCDIDVETGPRQVPSRWLRKRLEALYEMFPPPNGRPVLPEHLSRR
ncbi:hypothetical protein [Nevskia soli]|jgi:hypothetical protein|uniref:hypothetical protein n=1 Tax=Nevskia soli TaxID=418856 RepID=UPI0015D7BFF6|nr:hypothetical protein [Nevskia soli]